MSENQPRRVIKFKGNVFQDLSMRIKLILRLMGDRRVSFFLKLIPVGSLVYLIWPIDIPGPIDDAAVLWLGAFLFVELCPPDVVAEHMAALQMVIPGEFKDVSGSEDNVVEGKYREE